MIIIALDVFYETVVSNKIGAKSGLDSDILVYLFKSFSCNLFNEIWLYGI